MKEENTVAAMGALQCDSATLAVDTCKIKFTCKYLYASTYVKQFWFAVNLENKVHKSDLHESFLICNIPWAMQKIKQSFCHLHVKNEKLQSSELPKI